MRSEREIQDEVDNIDPEASAGGASQWPGMNYEQGVEAALMWVLGHSNDRPTSDE